MGVDRISNLPDPIVHHILSFLKTKQAVQTSILSKRWEHLWLTFPIFDFDEKNFQGHNEMVRKWRLVETMKNTLETRDLNHLQKLRIHAYFHHFHDLNSIIDSYIALAIAGKVQVLDLRLMARPCLRHGACDLCYALPKIMFDSGLFLVSLTLEGCWFKAIDFVNFRSLKTVSLKTLIITEQMLLTMICGCPLMESLILDDCYGLVTLRVFHHFLRSLVVDKCSGLKAFEMDVPNLQSFKVNGQNRKLNGSRFRNSIIFSEIIEFNISNDNSFSSLSTLHLSNLKMKEEVSQRMMSSFPILETICLKKCSLGKRLRLLCGKLKTLEVEACIVPELMEACTSNLQSLICKERYKNINIRGSHGMGFENLKTLSLYGCGSITDESLQEMVFNCPLLEVLNLKACNKLKNVKILSQKLKRLVLVECFQLRSGEIEAPKLVFFKYVGCLVEFSRLIASHQLDVELDLRDPKEHSLYTTGAIQLRDLLRKFDQARVLTVVSKCTQYVVIPKEVGTFPALYYLRHLSVKTELGGMSYLDLLAGVLNISFCQETLSIHLGSSVVNLKFQDTKEIEAIEFCSSDWTTHDCVRDHLIEVRLEQFEGNAKEMELVEFLLGKAIMLKTMLISITGCHSSKLIPEITTRIKNYPKVSPIAEIVFT